jgi:hypothetical protein
VLDVSRAVWLWPVVPLVSFQSGVRPSREAVVFSGPAPYPTFRMGEQNISQELANDRPTLPRIARSRSMDLTERKWSGSNSSSGCDHSRPPPALVPVLQKRSSTPIVPMNPGRRSKVERLESHIPLIRKGKIFLPDGFVDRQVTSFWGAPHQPTKSIRQRRCLTTWRPSQSSELNNRAHCRY